MNQTRYTWPSLTKEKWQWKVKKLIPILTLPTRQNPKQAHAKGKQTKEQDCERNKKVSKFQKTWF